MNKLYNTELWKAYRDKQVKHILDHASMDELKALLKDKRALYRIIDEKYNTEESKATLDGEGFPMRDASFFLDREMRNVHGPLNDRILEALLAGKISKADAKKLMAIATVDAKKVAIAQANI